MTSLLCELALIQTLHNQNQELTQLNTLLFTKVATLKQRIKQLEQEQQSSQTDTDDFVFVEPDCVDTT